VRKVARYDERELRACLPTMESCGTAEDSRRVQNAQLFLAVQKEFGSFDSYIWQFVGGRPRQNRLRRHEQLPARTEQSDAMSKDLAKRGFKFVGSTICYAFMQATGMVNDHLVDCFDTRNWANTIARGPGARHYAVESPRR